MRTSILAMLLLGLQIEVRGNREDGAVGDLVERLGDDRIEVRERASAALLRLGLKARAPLVAALAHSDAEVRARARSLLDQLDWLLFWDGRLLENRRGPARRIATTKGGGGEDTEAAVRSALQWLARHQSPDGSWRTQEHAKQCRGSGACAPNPGHDDFDAGNTALAVLAFLGAGHSPLAKATPDEVRFGKAVGKGLVWLMSRQDRDGCVGSRNAQKYTYNHLLSTLALAEAFAMTGSERCKLAARRAVDFTLEARNPGQVWRYSFRCGDNDTSVSILAMMSLVAAQHAGIDTSPAALEGWQAWLDEVTEEPYGRVGYTHRGTGRIFVGGLGNNFDHHETLTAGAAFMRILTKTSRKETVLLSATELLCRDFPTWDDNSIDYYYWHLGSLALHQFDGPSGPKWTAWNAKMKRALLDHQNKTSTGCRAGSWEPVGRWSGEGGRVYATALNALTLETYTRYKIAP